MLSELDVWVVWSYLATLVLLAFWGMHRLWLVWHFRWPEAPQLDAPPTQGLQADRADLPRVTVQLPIYNERTVAARLLRTAGALEYPAERLELQVLDDSDDETSEIVDREIARLIANGVDAHVVRRPDRHGFKAGALNYGLSRAKGELLCVFDADFTPRPDFLLRLVRSFDDPRVGLVQARWDHENRDESSLTRAQSALLDGHFVIEHKVRFDEGLFFNFNGTAGIWRRAAIEDAGGWEHDTLTEDLDLSYRAQLAGWRFVYASAVTAPAEVPPDIAAFKSQQHRWAKGSVQVARKLGGRVLRSSQPWRVKREALTHLTGNSGYPLVLAMAILLPLATRARVGSNIHWFHLISFVLCTFSVFVFYERSQRALGRSVFARLRDALSAMVLGIGICVSQTRAVFEGLRRDPGSFVRTPKRGDGSGAAARPYRALLTGVPGVELALAAWFAWGLIEAARMHLWGALPFLALFFSGFAWVGSLSLRSALRRRPGLRPSWPRGVRVAARRPTRPAARRRAPTGSRRR